MCSCFSLFLIFPTVFHVLKDPQIVYIFGSGTYQVLVDLHWQPTNDDSIPGASKSVFSNIKTRKFSHLFRKAFHKFLFHSIFVSRSMWHTKVKPKRLFVNFQTLGCQDPPAAAMCKGCRPSESALGFDINNPMNISLNKATKIQYNI